MRINLQTAILAASSLSLAGCGLEALVDSQRFHEDFHYSYTVKPGARLSLQNFNGAVEITAGMDDKIDVAGTKYAATESMLKSLRVEVSATPDSVRIESIRPSGHEYGANVRYTLRVPRQTRLDRIQTTNGSVRADGLELPASLRTTNGSITIRQFAASVEAQTSNGAIRLDSVKGPVTLRTTNGSIHAEELAGGLDATTTNGSITAKLMGASADRGVHAETTNGHIDLTLEAVSPAGVQARTTNSAITLRLPADANARVSATTTHGRIEDEFQLGGSSRGSQRRTELDSVIGSGGPTVSLRTTNGSIHLKKL
ncbi:MAG: DUF4097 family beta strand repeat-containing protein [Acidobacteria bacterium]|nr:DUF4097 family beta strand repeat-containing protein [Acidobacteriota bacterium]